MGKKDDSLFLVVEYLRREAKEVGHVHPHRREHWEIAMRVKHNEVTSDWELTAKWLLRRDPSDEACAWLRDLVREVSNGFSDGDPESLVFAVKRGHSPVRFTWQEKGWSDDSKRSSGEGERVAGEVLRVEEESLGLVGEVSRDLEEDG